MVEEDLTRVFYLVELQTKLKMSAQQSAAINALGNDYEHAAGQDPEPTSVSDPDIAKHNAAWAARDEARKLQYYPRIKAVLEPSQAEMLSRYCKALRETEQRRSQRIPIVSGFDIDALMYLLTGEIQQELRLNSRQIADLEALEEQTFNERSLGINDYAGQQQYERAESALRGKASQINQRLSLQLDQLLTPEQRTRFAQIRRQLASPLERLFSPDFQAPLKLSEKQIADLITLRQELEADRQRWSEAANSFQRDAQVRAAADATMQQQQADIERRATLLLTDQQRELNVQLLGAPYQPPARFQAAPIAPQ